MSLSDCIKCWDTPCTCGYGYTEWSEERLAEQIAMLERVLAEKQGPDEDEGFVRGLQRYDQFPDDPTPEVDITKIVVPTVRDKVQLLLALQYIHDLRCIDTDYIAVNTLIHHYMCPELIEVEAAICPLPPDGWLCTREVGHDGPCAAWPL